MTKHEKIVVSAYTGILMCDFGDLHQYIQEKLGRPVWTHELASSEVQDEIKEKTKADFLALCKDSSGEGACPICGYELKMCQCRFGGHGHPDRSKNRDVVLDHLYLLTPAQGQDEASEKPRSQWHRFIPLTLPKRRKST